MKNLSVWLAAASAAFLFAGCDRAPSIAGPESNSPSRPSFDAFHNTTNEMDLPWGDEEYDPCTFDMVTIAGTTHFQFITTFDDGGGFHVQTNFKSMGTGLGAPSLYTYTVKDDLLYSSQAVNPGATIRQEMDLMILGPRSVDNYIKHMIFKMTINNNGVPTASFDRSFEKCVG